MTDNSTWYDHLYDLKKKETKIKLFLTNSTMLQGKITAFDEDSIVIDSCLVTRDHVVSIAINNR